ncbi:MAG: hypothetical protein Q3996_02540 [Candidatus Saccharibacteria bacterium]|nr:hypothetical protein [Candidatus Saccharibacteria bacterium]
MSNVKNVSFLDNNKEVGNMKKMITGTWKEYLPGDEDKLVKVTAGTGWLTEDPDTAETMLRDDEHHKRNHSKVAILFMHDIPAAGIFFDEYGHIDSIFGTGRSESVSGPAIEEVRKKLIELSSVIGAIDALITLKEWKVLYSMEVKMLKGQPLSTEDLKFLFDIEKIAPMDLSDKGYDGGPLREFYRGQAEKMGILSKAQYELLSFAPDWTSPEETWEKFVYFLKDPKVNKALLFMTFRSSNLLNTEALAYGLTVDGCKSYALSISTPQAVAENLDKIIATNDQELIDIAMSMLSRDYVSTHLYELLEQGMKVEMAVKKASSEVIARDFHNLRQLGAKIDTLVRRLDESVVDKNYPRLIKMGADKNIVVTRMSSDMILRRLEDLINIYKVDRRKILWNLDKVQIFLRLKWLHEEQGFDINAIVPRMLPNHVIARLKYLVKNGVTVNTLLKAISPISILDLKDELSSYGLKINYKKIVKKIRPDVILCRLDDIMPLGIELDLRKIARKAPLEDVRENADALIYYGVSRQFIAGLLGDPSYLSDPEAPDDN